MLRASAAARWTVAGLTAAPTVAASVAFLADVQALTQPVCAAPVMREMACRPLGLADIPTPKEDAAYAQAREGGCEGLKAFARAGGDNPHVADALRLIATPRTVGDWKGAVSPLDYFVDSSGETRAQALAELRALEDDKAAEACAVFETGDRRRLIGVSPVLREPSCEPVAGRWFCKLNGLADCQIEVRTTSLACG